MKWSKAQHFRHFGEFALEIDPKMYNNPLHSEPRSGYGAGHVPVPN